MMLSAARLTACGGIKGVALPVPFVSRCLLYAAVAIAVARAPVAIAALDSDAFAARAMLVSHAVSPVFGPETAAAGSRSGGLGWLGALVATALAATPLTIHLVTVAMLLATLALVEVRARSRSNATSATAAAAVAALCGCDAAYVGAPLEAPLFTAALLVLLDRPTVLRAVLATALTLLWCNTSASGLLGVAFALAAALGALLDRRPPDERRALWLAASGACLATLATPAGLAYPVLAFHALRIAGALEGLASTAPSEIAPVAYHVGFFLVLVLGLVLGLRALRLGGALSALIALALALANGANLPLFGAVVAPLLAAGAVRLRTTVPSSVALALTCVAALAINAAATDAYAHARAAQRDGALLARRAAGLPGVRRIFCAPVDWCASAVASGGSVLIDDRVDRAPSRVRAAQLALAQARPTWRRVVRQYGIDAIVVNGDSALASLLRLNRNWRGIAARGNAVLVARRSVHA